MAALEAAATRFYTASAVRVEFLVLAEQFDAKISTKSLASQSNQN
jgi:hypothetical protein